MSEPTITAPAPTPGLYGATVTEADVRDATITTLNLWLPAYVGEMTRRTQLDLDPFDTWTNTAFNRPQPGDQEPQYEVYCPATLSVGRRQGDGTVGAVFDVQVHVWVKALDYSEALDLAGVYAGAVRLALTQQKTLGGFAEDTSWTATRTAKVDEGRDHTVVRSETLLAVRVRNVMNVYAGPTIVPANPDAAPALLPTAQQVFIRLDKHPITEAL